MYSMYIFHAFWDRILETMTLDISHARCEMLFSNPFCVRYLISDRFISTG